MSSKMTWKRRYEGETICLWGRNANFRFILVSLDEVWLPTVSFETCKRASRHVEAGSSERAAEVPALLSLYPDVSLITSFGCKWRQDSAHLLTLTDAPLLSSDSPRLTWSLVAVFDPTLFPGSSPPRLWERGCFWFSLRDARQPEVDYLHSWAVVCPLNLPAKSLHPSSYEKDTWQYKFSSAKTHF